MIIIKMENKDENEIYNYLFSNKLLLSSLQNKNFDLSNYTKKIKKNALQFWAINSTNSEIAGFMACYFNDENKTTGFITTITVVEKYQGNKIGYNFLMKAINYAQVNNYREIKLEVNKVKVKAISLYEKVGFCIYYEDFKNIKMIYKI